MSGAILLALASLAAAPQAAVASDIGEVIESMRLSRYPLREPERRAWGTENVKDAVLVGQMENRLYLYRYVRGTGKEFRLDFRSQPLVIDPAKWKASRAENVSVRSPRDTEVFYWVGYTYNDADDTRADGFLVDAAGAASAVNADDKLAVVTASRPWDEASKAQALATLRQALTNYPGRLKSFPAEVRFEHQSPLDVTSTFRTLHQVARAIPRAKTAEFARALADLRRFVMEQDYREIDPTGKDPEMLTALNDYGFWLAESGDTVQADRILTDVLRRDPARTAAYLNRADARWAQARKVGEKRGVQEALAREDYRLYCTRRLNAKDAIPGAISQRISAALNEKALTADACRPRLAIFKAIQAADLSAVRAELAAGQDPNGVNENGTSALAAAVSGKQLDIVQALLAAGARADGPNNGYVLLASALPDPKDTRPAAERYALADALIAAGAPLDAVDYNGTPLLVRRTSYYAEDQESLRYLLAKGANPNAREKNGRTALHAAMGTPKKFWFAELLLAKGADINAAYIRMYYGNQAMWETPLLEAMRESISGELTPVVTYPIPERVTFALTHGADAAVGGYSTNRTAPERNGLNEALALAARTMQPELVDQLAQAAKPPQLPLTPESLSSLLGVWNQVEIRSTIKQNSAEWDGQRAKLRATAGRLLAAGVPLTRANDATGLVNSNIAPLSLPWLPDDLYQEWLEKGADASDRTDPSVRIDGVNDSDALPLVTMLRLGKEGKAKMLLEHDAGLYRTPWRCGMAVADMLAWQLSNSGPISPMGARAIKQVLDGAAGAASCDLSQRSRVQPFVGISASELARRANVTLTVTAPAQGNQGG
ncbi:ankyrin repeat domain-containing protein [Achromobacter seleniivolatilans]|uniref:Ankyrin repeat domain-containing protein n=1 Tax=Achromobacter seleniivolatilans TaxID=3047478 RepID=A0ABY9M1B8_9BURK|nr:ankyrin repeat domain-containing protein [Achromobacter sp. R39]WMD20418.1 ankyrin repeat domain-containing protein [Achromobacter sp. R39]